MKIFFALAFLSCVLSSSCQVHWNKTSTWRLYRYQGNELFNISLDSLDRLQNTPLAQDSMISYLSLVELKHPKAGTHWMGGYIATCQLEGSLRKVVLSNYGGFFYDEKTKTYYQIPTGKVDDWLLFLQNSYMTMIRKE